MDGVSTVVTFSLGPCGFVDVLMVKQKDKTKRFKKPKQKHGLIFKI